KCKNPQRGVWGGPPDDYEGDSGTIAASKIAFAPRKNFPLANHIGRDLWEIGFKKYRAQPAPAPAGGAKGGTKIQAMGIGALGAGGLLLLGTFVARRRKK